MTNKTNFAVGDKVKFNAGPTGLQGSTLDPMLIKRILSGHHATIVHQTQHGFAVWYGDVGDAHLLPQSHPIYMDSHMLHVTFDEMSDFYKVADVVTIPNVFVNVGSF